MIPTDSPVKSGLVTLIGAPNTGKSTLLNRLLGQKISIVTPKPQTTRNQILGIINGEDHQLVLIDTPGLHQSAAMLNREMVRMALESLSDVDVAVFLADAAQQMPEKVWMGQQQEFTGYLQQARCPVVLVLNKIDLLPKEQLLPIVSRYSQLYPFAAIFPVSALTGDGIEVLLHQLVELLPLGPRYYPEDIPTNASERFLCAEIIREKIFLRTGQEVPYATAVMIESFREDTPEHVTIHAVIVVNRASQKGIIIGKGGHKLKEIGSQARRDIEALLNQRVMLKLWVKVKKDWSEDPQFLRELGFHAGKGN